MDEHKELQLMACMVHTVLASFHLLGIVYNIRRGNKKDTLIHTAVCLYDIHSAYEHYKEVKDG